MKKSQKKKKKKTKARDKTAHESFMIDNGH